MASEKELQECLDVAVDLARSAGKIASDALHRDKVITTKDSSVDLVTEIDKKVEDIISSALRQRFPSHCFIGEETSAENSDQKQKLTDDPTWMVDPIDGTTSFIHGFPFSAISIGMTVNKQPVVGVVYNFNLDQLFAAKKGGGATMNGKPIKVSKCTDLNRAMVLTELGHNRGEEIFKRKLEDIHRLAKEPMPIQGLRMLGSAALNMCMVACGGADSYFEFGIHCWDVAAGDIILREAGGVTMYPTGESLDVMRRGILCASTKDLAVKLMPHIHNLEQFFEAD